MAESSDDLERMSREQLILKARVLGVERAELMTRVEMRDEIVRRSEPDIAQQKRARGFLGVARDLVASVVEAGLNLPDAAAIIRGDATRESHWKGPPPVATVTLAEIYATQGHLERALRMLDEVLAKEPDHDPARALRTRLANATDLPVAPPRRRQKVSFADNGPAVDVPATVPVEAPAEAPAATSATVDSHSDVNERAPAPAAESSPDDSSLPAEAPDLTSASPTGAASPLPVAVEGSAFAESAPAPVTAAAHDPRPAPAATPAAAPAPAAQPALAAVPATPTPAVAAASAAPPAHDPAASAATPALEAAPAAAAEPALLTLSLSGQRQVYWELPAHSLTALRTHSPKGRPVVRVVSFRARSGRVERHASDLIPDSEVGFAVLPNLRADTVVRAVLGWETEGRFVPYVVASDLASGTPSALQKAPFRANPRVGSVAHEVEQRALSYCSRRPAH
jgi:hypothetical protein